MYDPGTGRFITPDPLTGKYPELSPYQFASNTPIWAIDVDGLEGALYGAGVPLSVAEKAPDALVLAKWLAAPASETSKRTLASQVNYNSRGVDLQASDFDGLTNGQFLLQSWGQTLVYNAGRWGNRIPQTKAKVPQQPTAEAPPPAPKPKLAAPTAEETVTVTRVQTPHKLSQRISVNEAGEISIKGTTKLYITIDDHNHATYYYNKKGGSEGGASIISFQVNKNVADEIRKMAVPQEQAKAYPNSPEIADPTKSSGAYGLPANYIEKLKSGVVKGTGKVETPKQ